MQLLQMYNMGRYALAAQVEISSCTILSEYQEMRQRDDERAEVGKVCVLVLRHLHARVLMSARTIEDKGTLVGSVRVNPKI